MIHIDFHLRVHISRCSSSPTLVDGAETNFIVLLFCDGNYMVLHLLSSSFYGLAFISQALIIFHNK